MEENERDIVVFEDEEGNEIELDVIRYFEHKGQEYAILMDFSGAEHDHEDDCGCGCEEHECECDDVEMYVFKVVEDGEFEEFVPVEEDMFDEILEVVEKLEDEE